jgi:hypothetical protein
MSVTYVIGPSVNRTLQCKALVNNYLNFKLSSNDRKKIQNLISPPTLSPKFTKSFARNLTHRGLFNNIKKILQIF